MLFLARESSKLEYGTFIETGLTRDVNRDVNAMNIIRMYLDSIRLKKIRMYLDLIRLKKLRFDLYSSPNIQYPIYIRFISVFIYSKLDI